MATYNFTKNGSLERPRNIPKEQFNSDPYGTEYTSSFSDTSINIYNFSSSVNFEHQDYKKFKSLKNTINYYSADDVYKTYNNFYNKPLTILSLNSIHLGDGLERGSIYLGYHYTGTLLDYATDKRLNGILYNKNDQEIGMVLYKEGFILINSTSSLTTAITSSFTGSHYSCSNDYPRWIYFGTNDNDEKLFSFEPSYTAIDNVSTNLFFINAEKNKLNHSNNITYLDSSSVSQENKFGYYVSYPNHFRENDKISIKNVVSSPFVSGSANFQKETYITRIGLYDKEKKLIGYASLATPVRKTENREFLFKLKIDI